MPDDNIEIIVRTTVLDAETPRDSEIGTPGGRKSIKSQRRNTQIQNVPYIPESPSRRTSFKLGKDGNISMEQEDIQGTNASASASAAAGAKKDDDQDKSLSLEDIKLQPR